MSTTPIVHRIKADIADAKAKGSKDVTLERLEQYIEELKEQERIQIETDRLNSLRAQRKLEIWKNKRQRIWDEWADKSQWKRESWKIRAMYKFEAHRIKAGLLNQAGLASVKALLWLNGGGAAALLAFLATLANAKGTPPYALNIQSIRYGLVSLFLGAGLAAGATGVDYVLGAARLTTENFRWRVLLRNVSIYASIVVGAASLAAFLVGGYNVYLGIKPSF